MAKIYNIYKIDNIILQKNVVGTIKLSEIRILQGAMDCTACQHEG